MLTKERRLSHKTDEIKSSGHRWWKNYISLSYLADYKVIDDLAEGKSRNEMDVIN